MMNNKQHNNNSNKLPIQVAPASPPAGETTPAPAPPPPLLPLAPTSASALDLEITTNTPLMSMEPQVILTTPTAATATTTTSTRRHLRGHHHLTPPTPMVGHRHLQQQYHYHHHQHRSQRHQHHQCNTSLRQHQLAATITTKLSPNSVVAGVRRQLQPRQRLQQAGRARTGASRQVIRASEYKNLRQSVPSLRRQRDVGKVEVVTEAARYIDHLHKTLIERFVLCGIPDSLKDVLGTDNAAELSSQHIMNLVSSMARRPTPSVVGSVTTEDASRRQETSTRWPPSKVLACKTPTTSPNRCNQKQKLELQKQRK